MPTFYITYVDNPIRISHHNNSVDFIILFDLFAIATGMEFWQRLLDKMFDTQGRYWNVRSALLLVPSGIAHASILPMLGKMIVPWTCHDG